MSTVRKLVLCLSTSLLLALGVAACDQAPQQQGDAPAGDAPASDQSTQ